jgi:hypothetical protein
MPSMTRNIKSNSDLGKRILAEVQSRVRASEKEISEKLPDWGEAENSALAYIQESQADRIRKNKVAEKGGLPEYTTITIPYSYAVLMAAHTYLTSVFMGRSPIMQFSGRHGESAQSVQAMEALMDYQMLVGKCLVPLYVWLYDALKYGVGVMGIHWEDRYESCTQLSEGQEIDPLSGLPTGRNVKYQTTRQFLTYKGNRTRNVQPQSFIWDVRFPAWNFQAGEYCGEKFSLTWNEVVRREKQGYYMNLDEIKSKSSTDYYQIGSNDSQLRRAESTDPNYQTYDINATTLNNPSHPSFVKGYEMVIEIIPKEWNLGSSDFPEKWIFTCTGDFSILMGCQPLGAFHCKFPYSVLSLEPEAYGIATRGFSEILKPVQHTVDWLINSHFFNVRAALNNRWLVDPSRIVMKDLLDPLPGGVVRLKQEAYGQDVKTVLAQFPVQDVTQNHLRDLQMMLGIGERTVGINDQIMGMLNAGGRKTATEVRTSTSFGVNRLKAIAEFFSASGFDQMSQIMVQNTQQYYDMNMRFRVAGDLMNTGGAQIPIDPNMIAGFYDFVPVDGTLPIDRYAQMNMWMTMFGQIRAMPEIMMQYDLARIFEWVAQLGGMKNIQQFKIQVGSPEFLQKQAMLGNMIPMDGKAGRSGGKPTPPGATSPEVGQIPGMGATG